MIKKQVLLCGTQYGQTYLPAIFQANDLALSGILAKGSDRSVRLAEQYSVPLYYSVQEVPKETDVAIVAINEQVATPIAKSLLQHGIDVLLEHPVHSHNLESIFDVAAKCDRTCHLNGHFSHLPPVSEFIQVCKNLNTINPPQIINVQCNSRTLFSTLEILMRCFGMFHLEQIGINKIGDYCNLSMALDDIPLTLTYQQWRFKADDSKDSPLGHQINITYPQGVLNLGGTFGPCLWFPLIANGAPLATRIYSSVQDSLYKEQATIAELIQWRKYANQHSIQELLANCSVNPHNQQKFVLHLSKMWSQLFDEFGFKVRNDRVNESIGQFLTPDAIKSINSSE